MNGLKINKGGVMKQSVGCFKQYYPFLASSIFLIFVALPLTGCAGGSSSGTTITTCVAGKYPAGGIAIDSAGNVWMTNGYGVGGTPTNSSVMEQNSSGKLIHTYATFFQPYEIAIDPSGNVWVTNYGNGTAGLGMTDSNVQEYIGAAKGPQYFPYLGPQWPGAE